MKKHVLFIVENSSLPYDVRVLNEALAVKEYGYDVSVIAPIRKKAVKRFEILEGISVYRHPIPKDSKKFIGLFFEYFISLLWEIYLSIKVFIKKPFHVIHSANPPDHIFIIALFFKRLGVKFIFDHHDLSPECYLTKFNRKDIFHFILIIMEKLSFKTADIIISTNKSYKSLAIKRGGKKQKEVFVVRNGPRLNRINNPGPNLEWKGSFKYLVAYLGVIGSQDQLDVLLKIIDQLVNERKETSIKFIIIGDGPDLQRIIKMSKKMKIEKYIEFTGYIPYSDKLFEILSTADICVNPEFKNDFTDKSTMIKIMEYMCFGKPIIQFETTEGRVSAGDASLYAMNNNIDHFCDLLINLIKDKVKMAIMGNIGKQRVNDYLQWDVQKSELIKAYQCLF